MNNGQNGQNYPQNYGQPQYSPGQFAQPTPPPVQTVYARPRKFSTLSVTIIVVLALLVIGAGVLSYWLYSNYINQKTDVQGRVDSAVNDANKKQADDDAAKFLEREKEPNRTFVGPDDYGRVTFDYPKTWSVYVANDVEQSGGTYQAYLNPVYVPPVSNNQQFALEVTIQSIETDSALSAYNSLIKNGKLKASPITIGGVQGTRLDGQFNNNIVGSAVVFKIRDKTLTVRTDAKTFMNDYNALIKTIKFNQ